MELVSFEVVADFRAFFDQLSCANVPDLNHILVRIQGIEISSKGTWAYESSIIKSVLWLLKFQGVPFIYSVIESNKPFFEFECFLCFNLILTERLEHLDLVRTYEGGNLVVNHIVNNVVEYRGIGSSYRVSNKEVRVWLLGSGEPVQIAEV